MTGIATNLPGAARRRYKRAYRYTESPPVLSVPGTVLHSKEYDGMVHLLPFTCMPEIIAQNIMPSAKEDIPVLSITCDEQMGKAGMLTRLEAFIDPLKRRRRERKRLAGAV